MSIIKHIGKVVIFYSRKDSLCAEELNCKVKFHPSMEFNPAKRCISKGGI